MVARSGESASPAPFEVTGLTVEVTTVADDEAILHDGERVLHYTDLRPDTEYEFEGVAVRTLPRPPGELLCRFATVNDVHLGEPECGRLGFWEDDSAPVLSSEPGEVPYAELMSRAAAVEIAAVDPVAVIAKGDLTTDGRLEDFETFLDCYAPVSDRLEWIIGNHECHHRADIAPTGPQALELPGVHLALVDTAWPDHAGGRITADQLEWLADLAATSDLPVLVMGHHHIWSPDWGEPPSEYFGIRPADSVALVDVVRNQPSIWAYAAGHTHRNQVVHVEATGPLPWIEVACVKDFPGSWAEYRVYEQGILQIHRRISSPEALAWSNRCRVLYPFDYVEYALGEVSDRCLLIGPR